MNTSEAGAEIPHQFIASQVEVNSETLECKLRGTRGHYRPEEERMDWIATDA